MQFRIMYIERKSGGDGLSGPARIGRVTFSRTGRSLYYCGRRFERLPIPGFKANYRDAETGEEYWISGCKKAGGDTLHGGVVEIDEDAREEYWLAIRNQPARKAESVIRCGGKD